MDVKTLGLTACALLAIAMLARILWLFTNRVPVLAHSENVDVLGDSPPNDPLNPPEHPQGLERLFPLHTNDMRLAYDVGGQKYVHDIEGHVIAGLENFAIDDMPVLGADPAHPGPVQACGPWY